MHPRTRETAPIRVGYFFHDTSHPDLARRVGMLDAGGAETVVFGFSRRAERDWRLGARVRELGATQDARFAQRILAVGRHLVSMRALAEDVRACDVILARNLEMLVLAAEARRRYAPHAALVYECLDIHRLMTGRGVAASLLRTIEGRLLCSCQGLIVSSPGFVREHFAKHYRSLPKVFLVENKLFAQGATLVRPARRALAGPPWRIGWYGMLRCRRSLDILSEVLRSLDGLLEAVVAGRPAADIFGASGELFQGRGGLRYLGPFDQETDLAELFRSVHFIWAVDYFEAGQNSDWLLPNRLYQSLFYGAVPIARRDVETGRWLGERHAGILLEEPLGASLRETLMTMTMERLAAEEAAVAAVPTGQLVTDEAECRRLVARLATLKACDCESARGGDRPR
jgi:hypothetical protein